MVNAGMILLPVLGGLFASVSALFLVLWMAARQGSGLPARLRADPLTEPRTLRFRNGYLVAHSDNTGFLLADPGDRMGAWEQLRRGLAEILPEAPAALRALEDAGTPFRIEGVFGEDRLQLIGYREGEDLCLTIAMADFDCDTMRIDRASLAALARERDALIRSDETSPALSWAIDAEGRVAWSNTGYRALVERCHGADAARGWPLHALFPEGQRPRVGRSRRKCQDLDGAEHWYDVTVSPPDAAGISYGHAISIDAVIQAETALHNFIQTLTRSFASLPTGLAIFDGNGRLALFNPAILEMTGLDAAWLSRRPHITEVFDAMRDSKRIPEPANYKAWRDRIIGAMASEESDRHVQRWTMPNRTSYRLTAERQADGAITLLLEDVSAGVTAGHAHQQDRSLYNGMLDGLQAGVAVFDAAGKRVNANDSALAIWFEGKAEVLLPQSLSGCITLWSSLCRPSPFWGELRDLARGPLDGRAAWEERLTTNWGAAIDVQVLPQSDGGVALALRSDRALPAMPKVVAERRIMSA